MTEGSTSEKKIDSFTLEPKRLRKNNFVHLEKKGFDPLLRKCRLSRALGFWDRQPLAGAEPNEQAYVSGNRHTIMCLIGSQDRIPNYWSGSSVMRNISGPLTLLW